MTLRARASSLLLRPEPPSRPAGLIVALIAVAAITAVIFPLRTVSPPVSNGVLYLLAVLLVSTVWGPWLGLLTSVVSAAAFNFFHIPPTGRFTIADGRNWVALGVFLVAAVVASSVADLARSRAAEADVCRREADLAADLARLLLGGASVEEAVAPAGARVAAALGVPSAEIRLGSEDGAGTLLVPEEADEDAVERVRPAVKALVSAALDRARAEAGETQALRRSDELKTALLRTVSHDLRSPLTAIITAADAVGAEGVSASERADLAGAITAEASRLSSLVEKLLDLSLLQAGVEQVSVRARAVRDRLLVRIVDRGPGSPHAEIARSFELFYRPASDRSAHPGSGLGLAIVRGFGAANGGSVWAESLPGRGATFVVALPVEQRAAVAGHPPAGAGAP